MAGRALEPRTFGVGEVLANGSFEGTLAGWGGYNAKLSLASDGVVGRGAARVALAGSATDFSIYLSRLPVARSTAGDAYTASAWVRSATPGRTVCLRIRERAASSLVRAAQSCQTSSSHWARFAPLSYTVRSSGDQLDAYVYETGARHNDSFEVDGVSLSSGSPAPSPTLPTLPTPPTPPTLPAPPTPPALPTLPTLPTLPAPPAPPALPPPPRSGIAATAVDSSHIRLDWAPVAGASSYSVSRGGLVLGSTSATSFTDALLWPETRYAYTVSALSGLTALAELLSSATTAALSDHGFPRPFAATSFWNTPVAAAAVSSRNPGQSAYFAAHANNPNLTLRAWAVGVAEVHPSDPSYNVPCTIYACTLQRLGAIRIPVTAKQDPAGDGHLALYDPDSGREWDMWQAKPPWSAAAGAAVSMADDGLAPAGTASGNAANFPLLGGLIRPEEILQGRIDHALVFGMPGVASGRPLCPATHNAGSSNDANALPEGAHLQLDPSIDVDALAISRWQKTIARALQRYGMYLRDGGGSLSLYAENTASRGYDAWATVGLGGVDAASLAGIPWSRMRVLDAAYC